MKNITYDAQMAGKGCHFTFTANRLTLAVQTV